MKDTTRVWLVFTAIVLGSAECSPSKADAPKAVFENNQWSWQNTPQRQSLTPTSMRDRTI